MKRTAKQKRVWASVQETLRVLVPTDYPVSVRLRKLPAGDHGDAEFIRKGRRHYVIRVNSDLTFDFQLWVLIHEWAHCMSWSISHARSDDHSAHFGICYAEAYRAVYGNL